MEEILKKKKRELAVPLILFFFLFLHLVMHMNCDTIFADDWTFMQALNGDQNLISYALERWQTWSSRFLIEGVLVLTTHSIRLWRVLDSLIMVLMTYSLARLAGCDRRPAGVILSGLMTISIPFQILRSTGWQASSLNYYWPLALGLFAAIPLADGLRNRKTEGGIAVLSVPAALFAANAEQIAAGLFGAYLVFGCVLWFRERKIRPLLPVIFLLVTVELLLILSCPGNAVRAQRSASFVNLRDYGQFSLIDKLSIGLTSTTSLLLFYWNPLLWIFGTGVLAKCIADRRGAAACLAAALPLLFAGTLPLLRQVDFLSDHIGRFGTYVLQAGPAQIGNDGQLQMLFAVVLLLELMAFSGMFALGKRPAAGAFVLIFGLGLAMRMAVSFSPTVVESGERTLLPLYGCMMLCVLLVTDEMEKSPRRWPYFALYLVCLGTAGLNFLNSFSLAQ